MENFSDNLVSAVYNVINIVTYFARMNFPGTNIPYIMIPVGVWGIYFVWKFILGNMFDVEWKK